jgi:AcrR family transcriptional regulator
VSEPQSDAVNRSQIRQESDANSTNIRLIDALLDFWADAPADGISVRALVQQAGAAQAAIHYHFGDMERLYVEASAAALSEARGWMEARSGDFAGLAERDLGPGLQASLIASAIADWTGGQRRLAMAARAAPSAGWQAAWDDFWAALSQAIGLGDHAAVIASFAAGESARQLLVWNPALDRALLEETTAALVLWLRERRFAANPVRAVHQELALGSYDRPAPRNDALAAQIEQAAADLLAQQGHAGVTFRAVAVQADVTLGRVIQACGTKSDLLRGALHRLYLREALGGDQAGLVAQRVPADVMFGQLLDVVLAGSQPVLRAYDEIERAIYNGDEYADLRGVVRSMEDPSGTWALQQLLGGRAPPAALVAVFSAIIRGIGFRVAQGAGEGSELRGWAQQALSPFAP